MRDRGGNLVLERVACEGRVIDLDIDAVLVHQVVFLQEGVDRGNVRVVLMLRGLVRLGLDQERPIETNLVLVLGDEGQKAAELIGFPTQIGVEKSLVALAAAPQDVVLATQSPGGFEHVLHLGRGVGEDLGIRVGRGPSRITRMAEEIRGAPEQPETRFLHLRGRGVGHLVQPCGTFGECRAFGRDVPVVEAVEGHTELREELEGDVELPVGECHLVAPRHLPGAIEGAIPEDVVPRPAEGVPITNGEPEVILHAPSRDFAVPVVDPKAERVGRGVGPHEGNGVYAGEEGITHRKAPRRRG